MRPTHAANDTASRRPARSYGLLAVLAFVLACAASPVVDTLENRDPSQSNDDQDGASDEDDDYANDDGTGLSDDDAPADDGTSDDDSPKGQPGADAGSKDAGGKDASASDAGNKDAGAGDAGGKDAAVSADASTPSNDAGRDAGSSTPPADSGTSTPPRDASTPPPPPPPPPAPECRSPLECAPATCPLFGSVPCCRANGECGCRWLPAGSCN